MCARHAAGAVDAVGLDILLRRLLHHMAWADVGLVAAGPASPIKATIGSGSGTAGAAPAAATAAATTRPEAAMANHLYLLAPLPQTVSEEQRFGGALPDADASAVASTWRAAYTGGAARLPRLLEEHAVAWHWLDTCLWGRARWMDRRDDGFPGRPVASPLFADLVYALGGSVAALEALLFAPQVAPLPALLTCRALELREPNPAVAELKLALPGTPPPRTGYREDRTPPRSPARRPASFLSWNPQAARPAPGGRLR